VKRLFERNCGGERGVPGGRDRTYFEELALRRSGFKRNERGFWTAFKNWGEREDQSGPKEVP